MRLASLLWIVAALASAGNVKYAYDAVGRLISADYGNGSVVTYIYDKAGNLLTRSVQSSSSGPVITLVTVANGGTNIAQNTFYRDQGRVADQVRRRQHAQFRIRQS